METAHPPHQPDPPQPQPPPARQYYHLLHTLIRGLPLSEFNLRPIIVAAIAAAVAAIIWHLVRSRFISHDNYTTRQSY